MKSSEVEPLAGGSTSLNWSIDPQTGRLTTNLGLDLGGNSIQNVSAIMSASGNWRIDESGKLVVKSIRSEEGYAVPDADTGALYCIKVKSGAVAAVPGECAFQFIQNATGTPAQ